MLKRFGYAPHGRAGKGVLLRYIGRMTGLSRQQVTRLVRRYRKDGKLSKKPRAPKRGFTYRYTAADVAMLAETNVLPDPPPRSSWNARTGCSATRAMGAW